MSVAPPDPFGRHNGGVWMPVPTKIVARWPAGQFAENLAVSASGNIFISLHTDNRIVRFDPTSGRLEAFATTPAPVSGLIFDGEGVLWATGGSPGTAPGYIWRVSADGAVESWLEIEDAPFLNGGAQFGPLTMLICESLTGQVFQVDQRTRQYRTWVSAEILRPRTPAIPGANGVKLHDRWVYISVTERDLIVRAPITSSGAAGPLETWTENLRADDFAFGGSGSLYIATHPAQTVMRIGPNGDRATLAGPDQGAVGTTACAFGRTSKDATALYVTTSGGLFAPYRGALQEAKLLRLHVGDQAAADQIFTGQPRSD